MAVCISPNCERWHSSKIITICWLKIVVGDKWLVVNFFDLPCLISTESFCIVVIIILQLGSSNCHFLSEFDEFRIGNIYNGIDEELKDYFIKLNDLSNKPKCSSCWAKYLCGGGCIAHSYLINSDPLKPPYEFCSLQKRELK